jgi:hypothetical protein
LRDPTRAKSEVLDKVLQSNSRQLEESTKNIDEIRSILVHWVKNSKERTAISIILDDQKKVVKVVKALGRLVDDLTEVSKQYV